MITSDFVLDLTVERCSCMRTMARNVRTSAESFIANGVVARYFNGTENRLVAQGYFPCKELAGQVRLFSQKGSLESIGETRVEKNSKNISRMAREIFDTIN